MIKPHTNAQLTKLPFLAALAAMSIIGGSTYILLRHHSPAPTTVDNTITYSTTSPAENLPGRDYRWPGKPTEPRYITLPSIRAGGYIQKVGIDQNKALAVPSNIHMAAWFNGSVLPGQPGLSIIDGHVHGKVQEGIFMDLVKLKQGDRITIEFGNASKKTFSVVKSITLDPQDAPATLFSQEPTITRQLNLITCSGTFDKKSQQYTKRTIVITSHEH